MALDGMKTFVAAAGIVAGSGAMADTGSVSYKQWAAENPDQVKQIAAERERKALQASTHNKLEGALHDSTGQAWRVADASKHSADIPFQLRSPSDDSIGGSIQSKDGLTEIGADLSEDDRYALFLRMVNSAGSAGLGIDISDAPDVQKAALTLGLTVGKSGILKLSAAQIKMLDREFKYTGGTAVTDLDQTSTGLEYTHAFNSFLRELSLRVVHAEVDDVELHGLNNATGSIIGGKETDKILNLAFQPSDSSRLDLYGGDNTAGMSFSQNITSGVRWNVGYGKNQSMDTEDKSLGLDMKLGSGFKLGIQVQNEIKNVRAQLSYVWGESKAKKTLDPLFHDRNENGGVKLSTSDIIPIDGVMKERQWIAQADITDNTPEVTNSAPEFTQNSYNSGQTVNDAVNTAQTIFDLKTVVNDADNDSLTYSITNITSPLGSAEAAGWLANLSIVNGVLQYSGGFDQDLDAGGTITATIQVSDGQGGTDTADVTFTFSDTM